LDEKKKQLVIKRRKDNLYTKWIQVSNEWSKITLNDVKKMINEKSLRYAEVVVEKERNKLFR
jgi:ribosome-interacting GTPase 1